MRSKFSQRWWMIVAALAFVSVLAAHSVEPSAINVPNSAEAQSGSSNVQSIGKELEQEQPTHTPSRDTASSADVETALRFNELRRELLDGRGKMVDRWLAATAIFLTLIGVGAAILGYFGFKKLDRIENEARKDMEAAKEHAEEAKNYVQEIKKSRDEAASHLKGINAEIAGKDPEKASKIIENVQQNSDLTLIDKAVATALSLQQQDKIEEAIQKWTSIANILEGIDNERAAEAWFSVGYLISSKNKDSQKAVQAYDKSIKLYQNSSSAYNNRGIEKVMLKQYESAITDFNAALALKPDCIEYYSNRGNAKEYLGQYESAIADYNTAIALKPDYTTAYYNRGNAKQHLGEYESAIADYDMAIDLKPDYTIAYHGRGSAKVSLGQYDSAIIDYGKAIALKSDDAVAYNNRGGVKASLGQYDSAIIDYDKAIALKPDDAVAYYNRGESKARLNRIDEARQDIEKALKLAQDAGITNLIANAVGLLETLDKGEIPCSIKAKFHDVFLFEDIVGDAPLP